MCKYLNCTRNICEVHFSPENLFRCTLPLTTECRFCSLHCGQSRGHILRMLVAMEKRHAKKVTAKESKKVFIKAVVIIQLMGIFYG